MRLRVAERILQFTTEVRQLESFLPICGYCKKIRDDSNYWQQIESYFKQKQGTQFSHSVCPDCMERVHLTSAAYEEVRAHGARFILVAGHEIDEIEEVVDNTLAGSVVVEKQGVAGERAETLDPRAT